MGVPAYKSVYKQFSQTVNSLQNTDRFATVYFAAQLLQYYTIICDEDFSPKSGFTEFQEFLFTNRHKFGDMTGNVLVTEYCLIKIYNDLAKSEVLFTDKEKIMGLKEEEQQIIHAKVQFEYEQLMLFKEKTEQWKTGSPG